MTITDEDWENLEDFAAPGEKFDTQPDPEGEPLGERVFSCDEPGCKFTTKSEPGLRRHRTRSHGADTADTPTTTPAPARSGRSDKLHDQAEAFTLFFYEMFGGMWEQADPVCGKAWRSCRPAATEAWYDAAKKNKTVRRMLESTENVGVVGALVVAHMPVLAAVQSHHVAPRIAEARRRAEEAAHEPEQPTDSTADFLDDGQPGSNGVPG